MNLSLTSTSSTVTLKLLGAVVISEMEFSVRVFFRNIRTLRLRGSIWGFVSGGCSIIRIDFERLVKAGMEIPSATERTTASQVL